jgi:hypothetical protein
MSEWGVADVVDKSECFDEVFIQVQNVRDGSRNLRDLDGVGETCAEMIGEALGKYLRLVLQTSKGTGVNDVELLDNGVRERTLHALHRRPALGKCSTSRLMAKKAGPAKIAKPGVLTSL